MVFPLPAVERDALARRTGSGVWRFGELIAPWITAPVSLHEGNTPLYAAPSVAAWAGASVTLKHEGMNPTGSFKDRGMTVAMSQARAAGFRRVACASTGNTAASMAAYAAVAGVDAVVLVPEGGVSSGKLMQSVAYGARVVCLRGDFDDAMRLVQESASSLGLYLLNSINPFRLMGQQSIVWELLMQRGWRAPDWIAFPAGNLGNCAAFGRALGVAHHLGFIDRLPRLLAVQAAGANPFAAAYRRGFDRLRPVAAQTLATAIRIGEPVSYDRAVAAIRATHGVVTDVSDAEILSAKAVVDRAGIGAEPASCAPVAGVRRLVAEGVIQPGADVVCVLTGHLLKDPDTTWSFHQSDHPMANRPVSIEPSIGALGAVLGATGDTK